MEGRRLNGEGTDRNVPRLVRLQLLLNAQRTRPIRDNPVYVGYVI